MIDTKKRHPHAYTLELLKIAVKQLPPGFSKMDYELYENKLNEFLANPDVSYDEIHAVIVDLGLSSWPYRRAFGEMYERYGHSSEESYLLDNLDKGVRDKYEKFLHEGGKINHIMEARRADDLHKPSPFSRYFNPEERFALTEALTAARVYARVEIVDLVTDKKAAEYDDLVEKYRRRQKAISNKLSDLEELAEVSSKWSDEIKGQVKTFREGWSVVEKPVYVEEVDAALNYWRGTLGTFLKTP